MNPCGERPTEREQAAEHDEDYKQEVEQHHQIGQEAKYQVAGSLVMESDPALRVRIDRLDVSV